MFAEIFRFEVRYQLRQPIFWISAFFFFLIAFLAVTTDAVVIGGSIGNVNRNAPFVIMQLLLVMSLLGVFVTTAFVASPVLRDSEHRTQETFFATPMKKRHYLLGRFLGALVVAFLFFIPVALAILIGSKMPWLEAERVGPFMLGPYLFALLILVWPNVLLTASIFFALATWTRSLMATYASVVAMFVGYFMAGNLLNDIENEALAAVVDPFGGAAFQIATKYWTVAERNTQVLALDGPLLTNRLLWTGAALLILALTYWRFSFTLVESRKARRRKKHRVELEAGMAERPLPALAVPVRQDFSWRTTLAQGWRQARMEVRSVTGSLAFPVILAFGVLNMIGNSTAIDQIFGTPVYPVTNLMIRILQGGSLFIIIILTFYSGELVWRERTLRTDEVHDTLPVPGWVLWSSKTMAMAVIVLALLTTVVLTGIGIQAWRGYTHFELGLYLSGFFLVVGVPLLLIAVLAIFLQVAGNHKYLGFLLMILYFISGPALGALDFDHYLYRYASAPGAPYSDMNGIGHFVQPLTWFYLYWSFFAVLLLVAVHLLWVRGKETGWRQRLRIARDRFGPRTAAVLAAAVLAFVATGTYIFYNTNVLNEYLPDDLQEERQARFEQTYKPYEALPQPRITAVYAEVDIYPERRAVGIRGQYSVRNKTQEAIDTLHLTLDPQLTLRDLEILGPGIPLGTIVHASTASETGRAASLEMEDRELGYSIYRLAEPLPPGGELTLIFDLSLETHGFVNNNSNLNVLHNGTFFNNFQYFPRIGYSRAFELTDPNDRRKHDLPPIQRMPVLEDEASRGRNYISAESDWIDFETVVSTSADQIALAPGYLQREWREGDRRYFHYKMDAPILGFFAYLSADWEVARDRWNDVAIEIYYHRDHPYNVERMIEGVKKSLDYFSREFGPYQHRQVRILEFPRYATFAQSFPNTIPFSESIGFIARLDDDPEAIDYVFYVTAHEVAHQWWAHQVIGGYVQGATVLSETLSQYSALMVMEHEYGRDQMRRFLKYELDNYLRSRGGELIEELPLLRVENQDYIHYRKGSVVMYALRDYLSETELNQAIRRFADAVRYQQPPYTTSLELVGYLREAVPPEQQGILGDLFEEITLYENRAVEATWQQREDGRYEVQLAVASQKFRADGMGEETEIPVDDWIDVGVFGAEEEGAPPEGKVLAFEKRRLTEAESEVVLVVDEEPRRAGIDPYNKLIDRNPENNITRVTAAGG